MDTGASVPHPENADLSEREPALEDSLPAGQATIEILQRWHAMGATWQVLDSTKAGVTISLCRCDGGEEAQRLTSADPGLLRWLSGRTHSDEEPTCR